METRAMKKKKMVVEEKLAEEHGCSENKGQLDGSEKLDTNVPVVEMPSLVSWFCFTMTFEISSVELDRVIMWKPKTKYIFTPKPLLIPPITKSAVLFDSTKWLNEICQELFAKSTEVMYTEVFSIFVDNTRDIKMLKQCRLVCKAWNEEVCAAFRIRTAVTYSTQDEKRAKEFVSLLSCRAFGLLADLPTPFRNFKVESDFWNSKYHHRFFQPYPLDEFIWQPQVLVTHVTLIETIYSGCSGPFEDSSFTKLLLVNSKSLELIRITLEDDTVPLQCHLTSDDVMKIRMKYEPMFSDLDSDEDEDFQPSFFRRFFNWPKLVKTLMRIREWKGVLVDIVATNAESLIDLFVPDIMGSLTVLKLNLKRIIIPEELGSLFMPRLQALKVAHNRQHIEEVASLLRNVAGTVKELELSYVNMEHFPTFPKLESLAVREVQMSLDQFPRKKFPVLNQVTKQSSFFKSRLY